MSSESEYKKRYDEHITKCLDAIVNMESYDEDVILDQFEKLVKPVQKEIRDKKIPYNLPLNIMKLVESQIILNPDISEQRRIFIMNCFSHYNEYLLDALKKKVENARQNEHFQDLLASLNSNVQLQSLYNEAYEDSIQKNKLTHEFLELLETYKQYDFELIEKYKQRHVYPSIVKNWVEEDTPMNQVDGGGRGKSKKNLHYKKYKPKSNYKHRSTKKNRNKRSKKYKKYKKYNIK